MPSQHRRFRERATNPQRAITFPHRDGRLARASDKDSIMPRFATALTLVALLATATLLSACNTTAGAGQDISSAGHAVTGAADSAK